MDRIKATLLSACYILHAGGVTIQGTSGKGTSGDACGLESSQRVIDTDSDWATTCKDCVPLGTGPMLLQ